MAYYQRGQFTTPPVVKNLLIVNVLVFLTQMLLPPTAKHWVMETLSLNFWVGGTFQGYQLITYMFLHANLSHLFFNMFALWMFGRILEYDLGSRRFFIFYMICGIGAGLVQLGVNWIEYASFIGSGYAAVQFPGMSTIGASGAIFGVLLGYGMMHPNSPIYFLFIPVPIKAKWFVIGYGVVELFAGIGGSASGVAHYAHVAGMLFGFLLLYLWKRQGKIYY
ncbi:MAG: rhomboid family intramembrane serine protease [Tidjanibacter sp.]|nr:rhomboid family intramembrane serine protease [Tidjanibacter sp.]